MDTQTAVVNPLPGLGGSCPRCMAELIRRPGGWRGLVDMAGLDGGEQGDSVYYCLKCGHYEDAVIRANRLAQHSAVTVQVPA